jgi:hypothetical protein
MRSLTEKQRAYVFAMASDPFGNPTKWCKAAGYSDKSEACKVQGWRNSHDPRIEAAAQEIARATAFTLGPLLGLAVVMRIAKDQDHPKHFQAGLALLDRGGLPAATEHNVVVAHTDRTGAAMAARIGELASRLGLDPAQLLGVNAPEQKMIDVSPTKE